MKRKIESPQKKEFEFTYRYRKEEDGRDLTSDKWIETWGSNGHTWGEMSPIEICEGRVKSELKSIQNILEGPYGDPNWVLKQIADRLDILKNWQYLLHCATKTQDGRT